MDTEKLPLHVSEVVQRVGEDAQILVSLFGPRGGTVAGFGCDIEQAHALGVALITASNKANRIKLGIGG